MSEFKSRILEQILENCETVFSQTRYYKHDGARYFPDGDDSMPDDSMDVEWGVQFMSREPEVLRPETMVAVGMFGAVIRPSKWAEFDAVIR
jgi:hypothetical protein